MTHIRPLTEFDFELIHTWENLPELWTVSEQQGPFSIEEIVAFVHRCLDSTNTEIERWIIESEGISLGAIDLFEYDVVNRSCGIGVFIMHAAHRNRGHATSAMKLALNMLKHRECRIVRAIIYSDNYASIRLFEKLGFQRDRIQSFNGKEAYHYFSEITS